MVIPDRAIINSFPVEGVNPEICNLFLIKVVYAVTYSRFNLTHYEHDYPIISIDHGYKRSLEKGTAGHCGIPGKTGVKCGA